MTSRIFWKRLSMCSTAPRSIAPKATRKRWQSSTAKREPVELVHTMIWPFWISWAAIEKNQSPWKRVFSRLGKAFDQTFGSGWELEDPDFWSKYKSPSYGVFYHRPQSKS